ncbi:uncharacterized protein LOC113667655 [Pocillopora damicornis]|uniref:uncharacterized protein LOC113667655 n=1 Tax=Pocillopora damicornis TaxID=46731 RepID=UPI000F558D0F|nr:uncharacterized protein LOC113667655 [Pocillopora damicornis]
MADSYQVLAICMLLVAISCVSRARDCIPVHGYESCACYFPAVNDTREYVNLLPLKTNSSSPRYVLCSLCKVGKNQELKISNAQEKTIYFDSQCICTICSNAVLYIFKQYLSLTSACCCQGKCGIPPEIPYTAKTPTGSSSKSGGLKSWEIAVITVGGVLLLVLIACLVFFCGKKRRAYQTI